jgi:putative transposase
VYDDRWSDSIAVGSLAFVENIKTELGVNALHREAEQIGEGYALRERSEPYPAKFASKNEALSSENTLFWNQSVGSAVT